MSVGSLSSGGTVAKVDGTTGALIWSTPAAVTDSLTGVTTGVDDPVATGYECDGVGGCVMRLVKYLIQQETPTGLNVAVEVNGGTSVPDGVTVAAVFPHDGSTVEKLLAEADQRM